MPDIDPAALSRPLNGPSFAPKTATAAQPLGSQKPAKTTSLIPARIDLEPIYSALKLGIEPGRWLNYKNAIAEFVTGRLNQTEYTARVAPILCTPELEHVHNQLLAAIYGNVSREMPDPGLAPWVSANDKPAPAPAPKPATGDAAERRLKGEIMQLPSRDRRRIKDLVHNEFDPNEALAASFAEQYRHPSARVAADVQPHSGGLNNMNLDLEIRKRFSQQLAVESGELPDANAIEGRMLPFCYENGLVNGHAPEAAQLVCIATETFLKEALSGIFSRTRSNGPGEGGTPGLGTGASWIQTYRYRRRLAREEDAAGRGEILRDKSGMLPVEARAAAGRRPLDMADLRVALDISESGMARFPAIRAAIVNGYREGELENWLDYSWLPGRKPRPVPPRLLPPLPGSSTVDAEKPDQQQPPRQPHTVVIVAAAAAANGHVAPPAPTPALPPAPSATTPLGTNGHHRAHLPFDIMDLDVADIPWEGTDGFGVDGVLDSCLAAAGL